MRRTFSFLTLLFPFIVGAQNGSLSVHLPDTLATKILEEITIVGKGSKSDIHQLPQIVGTNIYAGKKSALIVMDNVKGNVVSNTMRQVMSKVPGIFVWESESSGIQIGIASRGLSPNRSWEFNVRQNGYDIAADPYGYPEAYYNPQLQSVQRIEIVRGHGAIQYGPQIGGMINYILKNGSEFSKPFQFETFQTIGSNRLFNSYNAVGGKTKKVNYYAFFDHRSGDGWRENNQFKSNTGSGTITYKVSERFSITSEVSRWETLSQQPGGLTDDQFAQNPQQSLRSRNWFNLVWLTSAVTADYKIRDDQRLNVKLFGINATRNSIGFNPSGGILVPDAISPSTGEYNPRTIDVDRYQNFGMEARYLISYNLGNQQSNLSTGMRLYSGNTFRYRGGVGSRGTDFDINRESGTSWTSDIDYQSGNAALFAENLFQLTDKLIVVPGIRYEYLTAEASGYSGVSNGNPINLQPQIRSHGFVIGGLGVEYAITQTTSFYANATQSYRPVQFADLTTPPTTDVIDPNLTDARGLNADLGYRGTVKNFLKFDVSGFYLDYSNRVGTIRQQNPDGSFYNFRTNVGGSRSQGLELFAEYNLFRSLAINTRFGELEFFASYAYNDARYNNFKVVTVVNNALQETNYKDKKVEYAPEQIFRTGVTYSWKMVSATLQQSYTDKVFTDANNTETPTANGQNGLIPAYTIYDITLAYQGKTGFSVKSGINNLSDSNYFTRRAGGYPGPGVLPSDGRTYFLTVGYVFK
ncbi:MAG: TonB-dependent receptor [Cyclobacteriaceae bacterium]|nr:TonB-dependent receptor [Cyclobacteriaceae bacterium]